MIDTTNKFPGDLNVFTLHPTHSMRFVSARHSVSRRRVPITIGDPQAPSASTRALAIPEVHAGKEPKPQEVRVQVPRDIHTGVS